MWVLLRFCLLCNRVSASIEILLSQDHCVMRTGAMEGPCLGALLVTKSAVPLRWAFALAVGSSCVATLVPGPLSILAEAASTTAGPFCRSHRELCQQQITHASSAHLLMCDKTPTQRWRQDAHLPYADQPLRTVGDLGIFDGHTTHWQPSVM